MAFDLPALYAAIDLRRLDRGLSWSQVSAETGVAPGTLQRTARGTPMETDGVLAMTDWLGVAAETFIPADAAKRPPHVVGAGCGRINTRRLHDALNARRLELGQTWKEFALALGPDVSAGMLTHLAKGGRANILLVCKCAGWLGSELATFRNGPGA